MTVDMSMHFFESIAALSGSRYPPQGVVAIVDRSIDVGILELVGKQAADHL